MIGLRPCAAFAAALVCVSAADAQNAGTNHVQLVRIEMSNFAFTPNHLDLVAGSPVQLELVNTSSKGHDFDAPDLFAAGAVAAADRSKLEDGEVEVDAGQSVDVRFTPTKTGTYKFYCSHFLHSSFGMTGEAVVE